MIGSIRQAKCLPSNQDAADVSPGRERGFRTHLVPLRRQRRLHRGPLRPLRDRPDFGRCRVAGLLRQPEGRRRRRRQERARRLLEEAATGRAAPTASWSPRSTATGPRSRRRSATRSRPRRRPRGVELSAADVQQATRDSIRALMLIRAYRMRGHLHANLDPLGLEPRKDDEELDPRSYGFTEADFDRKIFLDNVLGLEFGDACARSSRSCSAPTARRSASSSCTSPIRRRRPGSRSASKGRTRRSPSPARASARSSTSWSRPKASRSSATSSSPAPSASASTAASR